MKLFDGMTLQLNRVANVGNLVSMLVVGILVILTSMGAAMV